MLIEKVLMDSSIEKYAEAISSLAKNKETMIFTNSGPEHASIVLSNILKTSESKVRMFAGSLNKDICDSDIFIQGLNNFLKKNLELDLLLEETPNNNSKAFSLIHKYSSTNKEKINIKFIPKELNNLGVHFSIGDNRMFRVEKDTEKFTAFCSFNNPAFCTTLVDVFERMFKIAKSIPV